MLGFRAAVLRGDRGQASEYAVLLALVAVGLLVALLLLRTSVGRTYGRIANAVGNPYQVQETGAASGGGGVSQPPGGGGATSAQTDPGKGAKEKGKKKKDGCRGNGDRSGGDDRGGCGDGRGR